MPMLSWLSLSKFSQNDFIDKLSFLKYLSTQNGIISSCSKTDILNLNNKKHTSCEAVLEWDVHTAMISYFSLTPAYLSGVHLIHHMSKIERTSINIKGDRIFFSKLKWVLDQWFPDKE